jgi:hypothetical protein
MERYNNNRKKLLVLNLCVFEDILILQKKKKNMCMYVYCIFTDLL